MWETMYEASGVGLAAPQINKAISLFLIDTTSLVDDDEISAEEVFKKVFINARIIKETGEEWVFNEGCLSIPEIREDITRKSSITIEYFDDMCIHYLLLVVIKCTKRYAKQRLDIS